MTLCFNHALCSEEDSVVLFSTSVSPEGSTSPSSSSFHHSPVSNQSKPAYNLTVKKLSYTITIHRNTSFLFQFQMKKKMKPLQVLKSVTFTARSSEILAIVGPSGTGKSSLLRVIAGRVKEKYFDPSSVFLNDRPVTSPSQLKKICGFVAQEDSLLPLLTVKETLMFSVDFRLKEIGAKAKQERVEALMQELGLVHVADSFVGDEEHRGISGGERKRLSIGLDMIHDPPILLLDEPTSGLDSSSALHVIELLSSMSKTKHRTIVLSIHQPSYRMFQYITNFLILSSGSVIHNGSIESLEKTINRLGFTIPPQLNALEFSMEIIDSLQDQESCPRSNLSDSHDIHEVHVHHHHHHQELLMLPSLSDSNKNGSTTFEVVVLCTRFFKTIYRTKQLFLARTMQALVGGFGLGSVYLKLKNGEEDQGGGVAERLGLFAFSLSFLLSSTVEALPIYLQERRVVMKEASRGAYKVSSYMIANTIVFLPFLFAVAILFAVPVYWLVGLNPSLGAFSFFIFTVWQIVLMASSLVLFLSAISPDFISGNSLISTVLGAFFLFSGYFIPKESIPKYWIFMYYVSLYRYPLDSLLINEYWSLRSECFSWSGTAASCVLTGNDVLKNRGLTKDTRWINVGIMLSFFVFYRFLGWIILSRKVSRTTI